MHASEKPNGTRSAGRASALPVQWLVSESRHPRILPPLCLVCITDINSSAACLVLFEYSGQTKGATWRLHVMYTYTFLQNSSRRQRTEYPLYSPYSFYPPPHSLLYPPPPHLALSRHTPFGPSQQKNKAPRGNGASLPAFASPLSTGPPYPAAESAAREGWILAILLATHHATHNTQHARINAEAHSSTATSEHPGQ